MSLERALQAAQSAARGVVRDEPIERALALLAAPRTVAVVGRTSAGKTTLINRQTGRLARSSPLPTGLGGVTREVVALPEGPLLWHDTPGIDDPDSAVLELGPVLERTDGVVWVVDALQPMTASERATLSALLRQGTSLWVVVARLDLVEPEERGSVLERARVLAAPYAPLQVVGGDNRRDSALALSLSGMAPGPWRRDQIRAELSSLREALGKLPPVTHPDRLRERFRAAVREIVQEVGARIDRGGIAHEAEALGALHQRADEVLRELHAMTQGQGPALPMPETPSYTSLGQVVAGLAGGGGARRALKASAGRWMLEGELALADWPRARAWQEMAEAREALSSALDAVEQMLDQPASI